MFCISYSFLFNVMTFTSGHAPKRNGTVPPTPNDTCSIAPFSIYFPPHSLYAHRAGENFPIRSCPAWVCPERVRAMSVLPSTSRRQWLGSWLYNILNMPPGNPVMARGRSP